MQFGGTSFATTAPAATTDPEPTRTPGVIVAFAPIQTLHSMMIGAVVIPSNRSFGSTGCPAVLRVTPGPDHRTVPNGDAAEIVERAILLTKIRSPNSRLSP